MMFWGIKVVLMIQFIFVFSFIFINDGKFNSRRYVRLKIKVNLFNFYGFGNGVK